MGARLRARMQAMFSAGPYMPKALYALVAMRREVAADVARRHREEPHQGGCGVHLCMPGHPRQRLIRRGAS